MILLLNPLTIGYNSEDKERYKNVGNLEFYCYNDFNSVKYEYYKKSIQMNHSMDYIGELEEFTTPIQPYNITSVGPMDSPWPMQSHDTHHTGRSPYSTENIDGLEKWRFYEDEGVDTTPSIDNNGIIYFTSYDHEVHAVYPNGTLKWSYKTGGFMTGSSPALAEDGTVYIGSWDEFLYAINPNGTRKWKCGVRGGVSSSPAIAEDGTIYVGTMREFDEGEIVAVNPNGTRKWVYPTGYFITSDPAIGDDGTVYCGSGDTYFYALNPNGTLKWRFKTGDYIKGPASIANDGTVYIGSWDDYLYALHPNNGSMKWRVKVGGGTETNPSIAEDGTIYVGGDRLWAIYPNGTNKWSFNLGTNRVIHKSCPAISADGTIYVGTNIGEVSGGDIIAVNPDGTEKWRKRIAYEWVDSSPSIGEDGTVYIGSAYEMGKGYLHAFGPVESNSPPNTPELLGKSSGKIGSIYELRVIVVDPDNNPVSFYIDWNDGTEGWERERASGEYCYYGHTWSEEGNYTIRVKAKDPYGAESEWGELKVTMPKNHNMWFMRWLYKFPILQKILGIIQK